MQFNSHATNQDLVSEINSLCDRDATSYPNAAKTRRVNIALEILVGKILEADGEWQWDDTNYTTLPRGTGTLVEGQETYSFATEYLKIRMIEVLVDSSPDVWHKLKPIESLELNGMSPEEYFGQESDGSPVKGLPEYYDKIGDSIILYPAPAAASVTLASGLRIWFQRTADLFTTTDTTQEPGIPSPFHYLLAYMAAIPYCMIYQKDRVRAFQEVVDRGIIDLIKHFGKREKDVKKVIKVKGIFYK